MTKDSARKKEIRARQAQTGEAYNAARRALDQDPAAGVGQQDGQQDGPQIAERDWWRHALVRVVRDVTTGSPYADRPAHYRAGRVLTLWQTGRKGRPIDTTWTTSLDVDLMGAVPADAVELVEVLEELPPGLTDPVEPLPARLARRWARAAAVFASAASAARGLTGIPARLNAKDCSAVEGLLVTIDNPNTAKAYAIALRELAGEFGERAPLMHLEGEAGADRVAAWFADRWGQAAAGTFNARLDALRSACSWWRDQDWLSGDPLRRIRRRARTPDRTRALDRVQIEALLTRQNLALRERTLFRLLYESAARAQEVLALDVADLDQRNRRAKVRRKGGAVDVIVWQTPTARLLPRLLDGRRTGPVFLTDRRARVALPPSNVDPGSGRARLSYRRAAELFERATAELPGGPWTLHQLRHSALTHAAEDGANTSTLLAYSGHTSVASLARYARVSPEALARWQAGRDPAARRR